MLVNLFKLSTVVLLCATFFQLLEIVTPSYHTTRGPKFTTKWHTSATRIAIPTTPRYTTHFTTAKMWTTPRNRRLSEIRFTRPKIRTTPRMRTSSRNRFTTPKMGNRLNRFTTPKMGNRFTTSKIRTTPRTRTSPKSRFTTPRIQTTPQTTTTSRIQFTIDKNHGRPKTKKPHTLKKQKVIKTQPKPTSPAVSYFPPPDMSFYRINVGPNYYQPHPQLQPLLNTQPHHPVIINSPVFVSPGMYRNKEDHTVLGTYISHKSRNLIVHDPIYNTTYLNTSYAVIHQDHNYDKPIPKQIQIEEHTLGRCGNLSAYCVPNTNALCLRNGTVFCITSINLTKPCIIDSKNMSCVATRIPCLNNIKCKDMRNRAVNIKLPCISRIQLSQDFSQKYSIFSNNKMEIFITAKSNITSKTKNYTDKNEIENLKRTFRKILLDLISIPGTNASLNQSLLSDIALLIKENESAVYDINQEAINKSTLVPAVPTLNENLLISTEINKTKSTLNSTVSEANKTKGIQNSANDHNDLEYLRRKYVQTLINITNIIGSKTHLGQALVTNITLLINETSAANLTDSAQATNGTDTPFSNATLLSNGVSSNFTNIMLTTNKTSDGIANITTQVNGTSSNLTNVSLLSNEFSANLTNSTSPINGSLINFTNIVPLSKRTSANLLDLSTNQTNNKSYVNHTRNIKFSSTYEISNNEFCVVLIAEPQPGRRKMTNAEFINYMNENQDFSRFVNAKGGIILNKFIKETFF